MSVKTERIASNIMKELSLIISEEVKDELIKEVSITHVDLSNDLGYAKIYYFTLSDEKDEIQKALDKASSFLRMELAERIEVRHTPELTFIYDESINYGLKIEEKIKELNKDTEEQN